MDRRFYGRSPVIATPCPLLPVPVLRGTPGEAASCSSALILFLWPRWVLVPDDAEVVGLLRRKQVQVPVAVEVDQRAQVILDAGRARDVVEAPARLRRRLLVREPAGARLPALGALAGEDQVRPAVEVHVADADRLEPPAPGGHL